MLCPYVLSLSDPNGLQNPSSVDIDFINYFALQNEAPPIVSISGFWKFAQQGEHFNGTLKVIQPCLQEDCEWLKELVDGDLVDRLFIVVRSPSNLVRIWLDGMGSLYLDKVSAHERPDVVPLAAARCKISEQYYGLSAGQGKDAVIQLIRAFADGGYDLEMDPWIQAFFAAGGEFRHAESFIKMISEMKRKPSTACSEDIDPRSSRYSGNSRLRSREAECRYISSCPETRP